MARSEVDVTPLLAGIRNPAFVMVGAPGGAAPAPFAREFANAIPCAGAIEIPVVLVQAIEEFLLCP